jgi:hypothetical protein
MRKRVLTKSTSTAAVTSGDWLDLESMAAAEVTSEDPSFPLEEALLRGDGKGWRAAIPGEQSIRLLFDTPVSLNRIQLLFHEEEIARTQDFTLQWHPAGGEPARQIVRQQFNFSPPHTTRELEDYQLQLTGVTVLELTINPDISGGNACASLAALRIA